MTVKYSIQGADFSTRQEGRADNAAQMRALFSGYDWAKEIALMKKLESQGEESCPAGLNIVREPYVFLHLCPNPDGTVLTHIIHTQPKKVLGLFPGLKRTDLMVENLPRSTAEEAITRFIAEDNDWLLANIK